MRTVLVLVATALSLCADGLPEKIRSIIDASPEAKQCFWGIRVVDAGTGDVVYAENDNKFFVPASNTKLFTTSLALRRLGPDYKFRTRVETDTKPDAQGRVRALRLIGGGDPNLSARLIPYDKEDVGPDPLVALRALADRVVAAGVKVVEGDVVGDDTAYLREPYPTGWSVDDPTFEYGAPVSALTLNDNAFRLTVTPGATEGSPASLSLNPAVEFLTLHNRTHTVPESAIPKRLRFDRIPGSHELVVGGEIRIDASPVDALLAVDDPALFAAFTFRRLLEERGVRIDGGTRSVHREADEEPPVWKGVEIAVHESAPLWQIMQVSNKVSQNLHTELILREIARVKDGTGSRRSGLKEISEYLKEIGVEEGQWNFEDASGLSRLTLITPSTVMKVLLSMYQTPLRDTWIATLPIGGVDGTLEKRFKKVETAARIHAKTGSLSHVSALSGYAQREDGHTYAFSILVNNYNTTAATVRGVMDEVALALLK